MRKSLYNYITRLTTGSLTTKCVYRCSPVCILLCITTILSRWQMAPSRYIQKVCVNLQMHTPVFVYSRKYVWNTVNESGREENFLAPPVSGTKYVALVSKQYKYEGFEFFNRPSNVAQIGFKSSIFRPAWRWNLMDDPNNNRKRLTFSSKMCVISKQSMNSYWICRHVSLKSETFRHFFGLSDFEIRKMTSKTTGRLFYAYLLPQALCVISYPTEKSDWSYSHAWA